MNMKGQTLLEALLAISLVMLVLSGISVTIITSLNNAGYGKTQAIATQYAQEGMEIVRKIRNSNYTGFGNYNAGNYCLSEDSSILQASGNCSPNVGSYVRSVFIEQSGCGVNIAKATVTVAWTDGKCSSGSYCHNSQIISCFSKVNPVQAP